MFRRAQARNMEEMANRPTARASAAETFFCKEGVRNREKERETVCERQVGIISEHQLNNINNGKKGQGVGGLICIIQKI